MKVQLYRYTHPDGSAKDWGWSEDHNPHIGIRLWWGVTGKSLQTRFKATLTPDHDGQKCAREKERKGYRFLGEMNVDERTGKVMATGIVPKPEPLPDAVLKEESALYWNMSGCFMNLSRDRLENLATENGLVLEWDEDGFTLVNPVGAHGLTRLCFPKTQTWAGVLMLPVIEDNPSLLLVLLALGRQPGVFLTLANERGIVIEPGLNAVLKHLGLGLYPNQKACAQRLGLVPTPLVVTQSFYFGNQVSVSLS